MKSTKEQSFWLFIFISLFSTSLLQAPAAPLHSLLHENNGTNGNTDKLVVHGDVAYVGGTNFILKLALTRSLDGSIDVSMISFPSSESSFTTCTQYSVDVPCSNTVRLLEVMHDGTLLACGTNAGRPKCLYFNVTDFSSKHASLDARNWLSEYPHGSTTSLLLRNGSTTSELYAGSVKGPSAMFCKKTPKLLKSDKSWMKDPEFIATYSLHKDHRMIYAFFNEKSSNFIQNNFVSGNKKVDFYSMVARVCSNDQGGSYDKTKWMTFNKVRLICPWPGNDLEKHENLFFDEMVSVHHTENSVYGIFRHNRRWNMTSYAICRFSTNTIDDTIEGKLFPHKKTKYVDESNNNHAIEFASGTVPPFSPGMCPQSSNYTLPSTFEVFVTSHTLVRMNVVPEGGRPFIVEDADEKFQFIFSQEFPLFDIIYLLSDIGTLKKIKVYPDLSTEVLFNQLSNIGDDVIISAKLVEEKEIILAVTSSKVISFPTTLCPFHSDCLSCHSEPGCRWQFHTKDMDFSCSLSDLTEPSICSKTPSPPENLNVKVTEERRDVVWDVDKDEQDLSFLVKVERTTTNETVFQDLVKGREIYIPCVNLTNGTNYRVFLVAINGNSVSKATVTTFTTEFPTPEVTYAVSEDGIFTVNWKKIPDAVIYEVRLSDELGNIEQQVTIRSDDELLTHTVKVDSGKKYRMNVTAVSEDGVTSTKEIIVKTDNASKSSSNVSAETVFLVLLCFFLLIAICVLLHNNIWTIKPNIHILTSESDGCSYNRRYLLIWRKAITRDKINGELKSNSEVTDSTRA